MCINPVLDSNPREKDIEEWIEVLCDVTIEKVMSLILAGEMMLPSVQTCLMAIEYIKKNLD